jgi:hypothetical protein
MVGNKNFSGNAPIFNQDKEWKLTVDVSRLMDENTNGAGGLIVELTPLYILLIESI